MTYKAIAVALLIGLIAVLQDAAAGSCETLAFYIDAAKSQLRRAVLVTDPNSAKDLARQASKSLEDAASTAQDCHCETASAAFDDAAIRAKRAGNASDVNEHLANLRQAIRGLYAGDDALKECAQKVP